MPAYAGVVGQRAPIAGKNNQQNGQHFYNFMASNFSTETYCNVHSLINLFRTFSVICFPIFRRFTVQMFCKQRSDELLQK